MIFLLLSIFLKSFLVPKAACYHKTTRGKCCSIPFVYKGITHHACTSADHNRLWCSLDSTYKGKWGDCGKCLLGQNTSDLEKTKNSNTLKSSPLSSSYTLTDQCYHALSIDATMLVSNKYQIIFKQVVVILMVQ